MKYPASERSGSKLNTAIVLLSLVLIALGACSSPEENIPVIIADSPANIVETITLEYQDWQGTIETYGTVEAAEEIQLSLDFPATVSSVMVDEGEAVKVGQLLIEMDQEKPRLRLQQASELSLSAKAALDESFLNLQRRKKLAEKETVSREILDNAELAVQRARAEYRQALATRQLAEKELSETRITSPVDGAVDVRAVETGQSVMAGSPLMVLQATAAMQVQTWVSEKDIALISSGAPTSIELNSRPGTILKGQVKSIGINADPATGNFPVEVIIEEQAELARPGMTARLIIQGLSIPRVLVLPDNVLADRNQRRVVYRVRDNSAEEVEPLLSVDLAGGIIVLSGLNQGDQLISSSLQGIVNGSPITLNSGKP